MNTSFGFKHVGRLDATDFKREGTRGKRREEEKWICILKAIIETDAAKKTTSTPQPLTCNYKM